MSDLNDLQMKVLREAAKPAHEQKIRWGFRTGLALDGLIDRGLVENGAPLKITEKGRQVLEEKQ